jgi:branched-chain amino acid transport system permease protein
MDFSYVLEVLVGGLLSGIMYSLVAIGFVLVYKTSNVLNFAQGSMVLFAALSFVSLLERGVPFWAALLLTLALMTLVGLLIQVLVLRPLLNRSPMVLFAATLGVSYVIGSLAQLVWGTEVHALNIGISDTPIHLFTIDISSFDLAAAGIAGAMVALLLAFFRFTRTGLTFRAAADDGFASLAVGLDLNRILLVVWTAAGVVAVVAGLLWGARLGVQFSLSLVVLKALPVLVLGGFDSITGAIVGGLIVGAIEKLAEVFIGPYVNGGIEDWIAYVAALGFLLVRPQGLFGTRAVERV